VAWTCPYHEFPLVRIKDGVVRQWPNPVAGAHGLLVEGPRAALVGGYDHPHDHLTVGTLRDEFHPTHEWTLTLPDDRPLPGDTRLICRGATLHAITGGHWYHFDLADLPA
jgi:hypothetical protein